MIHRFISTKACIPNEFHQSVYEIDFESLYDDGFRLILTDLDNTLISYDEHLPNPDNVTLLKRLENIGFEVIIISNNHPSRITDFVKELTHIGIGHARKPLKRGFKKAMKLTSKPYPLNETIVIGDQVMTDILGANRLGTYSILVNPIKRKTEKWYTKMNRLLERKKIKDIKRKYPDVFTRLQLHKRR